MKSFIQEFKAFATKGNVVDLAVAVAIGAAFGKIVSSLVDNMITPLIGLFMGGVNLLGYSYKVGEVTFLYGALIQSVIDFLIVAFVIFLVVKAINRTRAVFAAQEAKEEADRTAEISEEVLLLREIRDSLRNRG